MKTIPLDELLRTNQHLSRLSVDDGMIRLDEQLEFCRENIGTDQEWGAICWGDQDGPCAVIALCHPTNAAYLAHAANVLPELVDAFESVATQAAGDLSDAAFREYIIRAIVNPALARATSVNS